MSGRSGIFGCCGRSGSCRLSTLPWSGRRRQGINILSGVEGRRRFNSYHTDFRLFIVHTSDVQVILVIEPGDGGAWGVFPSVKRGEGVQQVIIVVLFLRVHRGFENDRQITHAAHPPMEALCLFSYTSVMFHSVNTISRLCAWRGCWRWGAYMFVVMRGVGEAWEVRERSNLGATK